MKGGKDVRFNVNCVFQIIFCFASEKIHVHFAVALFFLNGKILFSLFLYICFGEKCVGVTRSETG